MIRTLLVAALALLAVPALAAPPAPAPAPASRTFNLSKAERAALAPVQAAITAKDWAAARAALPAALAAVQGADARYAVGRFQLEIGIGLNDPALQRSGLDNLLASGQVPPADLPTIYRNRAILAGNAGDKAGAEADYARLVQLTPGDAEALISLAQVKNDLGKPREAVELITRAIGLNKSAAKPVDESWYKYALKLAYAGRADPVLRQAAVTLSEQVSAAYPTSQNLRDGVLIYRELNGADAALVLDSLRFMRVSGALAGERDWYDLADGLYRGGNYGEAKAVLDDGAARRLIDPKKAAFAELIRLNAARMAGDRASLAGVEATARRGSNGALAAKLADAWYGYGEPAKAIALYQFARGKGVDADLIEMRIAMALLASGDRAGARAAFAKVRGPREGLARFWLAWLARP